MKLTPEVDMDCQLAVVWELESQSPASANWNDTDDATIPCWTVALVPVLSVTFSRTLYVPVIRKVWVGLGPEPTLPSPKFHV